jgi:hypothetical protein
VADHVRKAIGVNVKCESKLRGNGHDNGPNYPLKNIRGELFTILKEQDNRSQKNQTDDIFTDLLKWSQSHPFNEADRKNIPVENGQQ